MPLHWFPKVCKNPPTKPETYPVFIVAYLQYAATLFCMLPWKYWKIPWHFFSDDTDKIADELGTNRIADELGIFCALSPVSDPRSKLQIPTSLPDHRRITSEAFALYYLPSTKTSPFWSRILHWLSASGQLNSWSSVLQAKNHASSSHLLCVSSIDRWWMVGDIQQEASFHTACKKSRGLRRCPLIYNTLAGHKAGQEIALLKYKYPSRPSLLL